MGTLFPAAENDTVGHIIRDSGGKLSQLYYSELGSAVEIKNPPMGKTKVCFFLIWKAWQQDGSIMHGLNQDGSTDISGSRPEKGLRKKVIMPLK